MRICCSPFLAAIMEHRNMLHSTWRSNFWTIIAIFVIFFIGLQTVEPKVRDYTFLSVCVDKWRLFLPNMQKFHSFIRAFLFPSVCFFWLRFSSNDMFFVSLIIIIEYKNRTGFDFELIIKIFFFLWIWNSDISC